MKVDVKMARSFNKAVSNPENIQSNGHVNWNFVDADVYMDVGPRGEDGNPANNQKHYEMFDVLADKNINLKVIHLCRNYNFISLTFLLLKNVTEPGFSAFFIFLI